MKSLILTVGVSIYVWFPAFTLAQTTLDLPGMQSHHQVSLGVKLEPELTTSLMYNYTLSPGQGRWRTRVGGGLTVLPLLLGNGNWRVSLLGAADWRASRSWGATFASQLYLAQVHNRAGRMDGLGVEVNVLPSHYGAHWTTGLDLGWQSTLLTYIKPGEATRENFRNRYPTAADDQGPVAGWYGSTAHRFRIGLAAARRLGTHLAWQVGAGSIFSLQRQGVFLSFAHAQVPVYAETVLRAQW